MGSRQSLAALLTAAFALFGTVARTQTIDDQRNRLLSGMVSFGWLDTQAQEIFSDSRENPFTTIRLDYRDAFLDPAFVNYRIQPIFSAGFQDPFGSLTPGTGVMADVALLRARPWPLSIAYSRINRQTLTTGTSASYARVASDNDDERSSVQWQLLTSRLPKLDFSYGRSSVSTRPEEVLARGFRSQTRDLALQATDARRGWSLSGGVDRHRIASSFPGASASGLAPIDTVADISTVGFQGQREIGKQMELALTANRTSTDTRVADGFFAQTFASYSARLSVAPRGRLSSWAQGRFTRSDFAYKPALAAGGGAGGVPRTLTTNQIGDWEVRYRVLKDVSVSTRIEFTRVLTGDENRGARPGNFLNAVSGVHYQRTLNWINVAASYTLYRYLTHFESESPSRQSGHALDGSVSVGNPRIIRATLGYTLTRSREEIRGPIPFRTDADRARAAVEKTLGGLRLEAHGDLSRSDFDRLSTQSDFRSQGFGGVLSAGGLSISFDQDVGTGDSVQRILDPLPGATLYPPILIAASDHSWTAFSGSWSWGRLLSLNAAWRDQTQRIDALETSRVEQREATVSHTFRLLRVEGGYLFYGFDFGSRVYRKSLILRITRDFRVL